MPNINPHDSQREEDLSLPNDSPQLGRNGAFTRRAPAERAHEQLEDIKEEDTGEEESPSPRI